MKVAYCFRLEKELGMGINLETNEPCAVYSRMSAEIKKELTDEEKTEQHEAFRKILAYQMGADEQYITPISEGEYIENTDDEEVI